MVVPVYNVENYLERCLKSLLAQDYPYIQIILVDDGSTDRSGSICDEWAKGFDNISVYHKENGGLSDARNFGLSRATGEYVMFTDSDDYIAPGAVTELMQDAQSLEADVLIGHSKLMRPSANMDIRENIIKDCFQYGRAYTGKEYIEECLRRGGLRVEVWRNLYRRDFLLSNGFTFRKGIFHEDEEFTPRVLLAAERVVLSSCVFYCYDNTRSGSIINSASNSKRKAYDLLKIYDELSRLYTSVSPRKLRRYLQDDICWKYIDVVYRNNLLADSGFVPERIRTLRQAYKPKRRLKALLFAISPRFCNILMTKIKP